MVDRNAQIGAILNAKLIETGEREQMKQYLRQRLIEHEWRDQMKVYCREIIAQKGLENITIDELIKEVAPKGRALVPDIVKREMMIRFREFLSKYNHV